MKPGMTPSAAKAAPPATIVAPTAIKSVPTNRSFSSRPAAHPPGGPQRPHEQDYVGGVGEDLRQPVRRRPVAEHLTSQRKLLGQGLRRHHRAVQLPHRDGHHEQEREPRGPHDPGSAEQQDQLAGGEERDVQAGAQRPVDLEGEPRPLAGRSRGDGERGHSVHRERDQPEELERAAAFPVLLGQKRRRTRRRRSSRPAGTPTWPQHIGGARSRRPSVGSLGG